MNKTPNNYYTFFHNFRSRDDVIHVTGDQKKTLDLFIKAIDGGQILLKNREHCLCGCKNRFLLASHDRYNLPFRSFICDSCGLIYTDPFISPESIETYYKTFYHGIHFKTKPENHKIIFKKGQGKKIYKHVKKRLNKSRIKVLDYGCGQGSVIKEFIAAAADDDLTVKGLGLEFNKAYVSFAETQGYTLEIRQGDFNSLTREDFPFDVIIMSHVFEHFTDPYEEIHKLKQFISPDSLIYIEVPGVCNLKQKYEYECNYIKYFTSAHIFNYNLISLTQIMNKSGFRLIWGNEYVESLFTVGEQDLTISNNSEFILSYLEDLAINEALYKSMDPEVLKQNLGIDELEDKIKELRNELNVTLRFLEYFRKTIFHKLLLKIESFFTSK